MDALTRCIQDDVSIEFLIFESPARDFKFEMALKPDDREIVALELRVFWRADTSRSYYIDPITYGFTSEGNLTVDFREAPIPVKG